MFKKLPAPQCGDKFGAVVVLHFVRKDKWGKKVYSVLCKCGQVLEVPLSNLRSGNTTQCESCKAQSHRVILVGRTFGWAMVIADGGQDERGDSLSECVCKCGEHFSTENNSLVTGNTQSCGCLQRQCVTTHGHAKHNAKGSHSDLLQQLLCYDFTLHQSQR